MYLCHPAPLQSLIMLKVEQGIKHAFIKSNHQSIFYPSFHLCISILFSDKALGETCAQSNIRECSDPQARCLTNGSSDICTCQDGFYDDTGFNPGGDCQNSEYLLVLGDPLL